ncbi:MAG TPA: T9SS type A sorting domain-containing protein, partial [Nitrososphaeraceae archaeon]|nr:T9SS type A sorting domain-containing protein [Nitrososphaeraceae archaeon]
TKGNIVSDTTNLLCMRAGSVVTGAADTSFVEGPVKKFGNTAFVFPTGKDTLYRALEISAPSVVTDAFTAEYFDEGQPMGETLDSSLAYVNDCNYWNIRRNNGSSNVYAYLYWQNSFCEIADTATLKIVHWENDKWNDLGHGLVTGDYSSGKIRTVSTLTAYGNLSLAYDTLIIPVQTPADYSVGEGFVVNIGQLMGTDTLQHPEINYYGYAGETALYLSDSLFSYVFHDAIDTVVSDTMPTRLVADTLYRIDMRLIGINNDISILQTDTSQGYKNFYFGDSSYTHALTYQKITYEDIYDDINLSFFNEDEFRFDVGEDGDPSDIEFYYQGADSVKLDGEGTLNIFTPLGKKQYYVNAYQLLDDEWSEFDVNFSKSDSILSLSLGSCEGGVPLMLKITTSQPAIQIRNQLKWSTLYGGNLPDFLNGTKIDKNNRVYAVGYTLSQNFPIKSAIYTTNQGGADAVIIKFKKDRSRTFSTYYGGSGDDYGTSVTVDEFIDRFDILITGQTFSPNFPPCPGCSGSIIQSYGGNGDAFIVKLKSDGTRDPVLGISTYYGGDCQEAGNCIVLDRDSKYFAISGEAYCLPGITIPLPDVNNGYYQPNLSGYNGFIAEVSNQLFGNYDLYWATHLGDIVNSLCFDANDNLFAFGSTSQVATTLSAPVTSYGGSDFPICSPAWLPLACSGTTPFFESEHGMQDHFISKFSIASNLLIWSTLFGGSDDELYTTNNYNHAFASKSIAVSPVNGDILVTGNTRSDDLITVPLTNAYYDNSYSSGSFGDIFIARFNECLELLWLTYWGYNSEDLSSGVVMTASDYFYIAGLTSSSNVTTLSTSYFIDNTHNNSNNPLLFDGFILKFNPASDIVYSTYFGGYSHDAIHCLDVHKNNKDFVVVGQTNSVHLAQSFPVFDFGGPSYYVDHRPTGVHGFISNLYNNCTSCREETVITIEDKSREINLNIFPNPSSGATYIRSNDYLINNIRIYDLLGNIVFEDKNLFVNLYECNLNHLKSGIYIIQTLVNNEMFRNKIIISH